MKVLNAFILFTITLSFPAFSNLINLNDFYADPSVTISNDGLSALMQEDAMLSFVVLANDPSYGDPEVIVAGENSILTLDLSFY